MAQADLLDEPPLQQLEPLPGVELATIERSSRRWRGFQTTWDVCAVLGGESQWRYRGRTMLSRAGSIRFKEPGEVFQTLDVKAPSTMRLLRIDPAWIERLLPDVQHSSRHLRVAQLEAQPARFRQLCRSLDALAQTEPRLARQALLVETVHALLGDNLEQVRRQPPAPSHRAVRRVREHIDAHFDRDLALDDLASIAEVHPVYLSRVFREQVGLPPHAYQNERRVEVARRLLGEGMEAAEVALSVGFFDQSHFIRHFKRITGLTPTVFRRLA